MNIVYFASMWGNELSMADAVEHAVVTGFDGVEGPAPDDPLSRKDLTAKMADLGLLYLTEITTGGLYVPDPLLKPEAHLEDFIRKVEVSLEMNPLKVNVMFGLDAWPLQMQIDAFGKALEITRQYQQPTVFELHRSRSMYNPWVTRDLLFALPELRINCDFSHWCAVAERLVVDDDPSILTLCAERCGHMHARVGYEQGPQVPDPRAPEYHYALSAHSRWWRHLAVTQQSLDQQWFTVTPEFGPDGYLHHIPYSNEPVADLREVNAWMMTYLRDVMNNLER